MMKKHWKEAIVMMGILSFFSGLFGCRKDPYEIGEEGSDGLGKKAVVNTSGVTGFSYNFDGTIGGNNFSYSVRKQKDGKIVLKYESMEYDEYGEMTREMDQAFLDSLDALYKKHNICRWEGYNKYNSYVCDGDGFSLSFSFADGKSMSAHGSNCYPEGYREFETEMDALFAPIVEALREEKRQEFMAAGFDGVVDFIMANFRDRGTSGSDSYEFLLSHEGVRTDNYEVRIHSESGDFLPPGDYNVCRTVPDSCISFAGVQALVDKYRLIEWYNYDKSAEDYNNSEWFQLSFGFSGGSRLSAMGTAHPDRYDEFRQDFLKLMAEDFLKVQALKETE